MRLTQFDLNLLRALDALLTERHVTRAASRLYITQQAASSALHRLREHFEDPLLVRHGRQFELTPQADALVEPVRNAMLAAQSALDARPSFDPATAAVTIDIAMSDYGIFVVMPILMRLLADRAPAMRCRVAALPRDGFDPLELGDLDFILTAQDLRLYGEHQPSPQILSKSVFSDDFVCVADPQRVDLSNGFSKADYRRARHNTVALGPGIQTIVEWGWSAAALDLNVIAVAPSFSAQLFMLPGTPVVATTQRKLAESLAPRLGLQITECPLSLPRLHERLMWHARSEQAPAMTFVRTIFDDITIELGRAKSAT